MAAPAEKPRSRLFDSQTWIYLGFIVILGYFTYFNNYWYPKAVFWDENYHIASAQKYLHGVYFMEQHPPLGKLLAALGEKIWHPNARTDQFLGTDYGQNFPAGFSFQGYRFFSALLGWLGGPLLFLIFLLLLRNSLQAALLSFFYVFDNALIVHIRGAMLEGPLVFFSLATILAFFLIRESKPLKVKIREWQLIASSILFGVALGCTATTKVLGLIFLLLVPAIAALLWPNRRRIGIFFAAMIPAFLLVYCGVWQIHFSLGRTINASLPDNGYYQASPQYKQILLKHTENSIASFPVMLLDSWKFVGHYNAGAPRLDLCKPDENGSPWFFWPLGGRTINYRWETPDSKSYRYLYLVPNPVVWFTGFAAVLVALALLLSSVLLPLKQPLKHRGLLALFTGMYVCYFIAISRIERVLYLYHYFIPLILTFIILGLVVLNLRQIGKFIINEDRLTMGLMVLAGLVCLSFQFYRPFTYYEPLTNKQFQARNLFPLWEMACVGEGCQKTSMLVVPRNCQQ